MIEAWGRSFDKIREVCNLHNTPLPEYDIQSTGIMVLCKPNEKYMELLREKEGFANGGERIMSEYERIVSECLTEAEKESMNTIIEYLRENEVIDNKTGRNLTGKTSATVRRYLVRLCDIGLISAQGVTRNVIYKKMSE
jgi:ATP-dependent DNA helicase RecG